VFRDARELVEQGLPCDNECSSVFRALSESLECGSWQSGITA
jgi:hypothetical protein